MHSGTRQRIEICGHGGNEGLALAGLHLGDHPPVKRTATDYLNIERAHTQHAPGGLAHNRKRLDLQIVERSPVGQSVPELTGPGPQVGVGQGLDARFQIVDGAGHRLEIGEHFPFAGAQDFAEK